MAKKGKSGSKKKQSKEVKDALPEVDKEFYEIQIADLNKKLSRLRAHCAEVESQYDEAVQNFKKLDEDRADIIAYLKRTVQRKNDEIAELNERNQASKKASEAEIQTLKLDMVQIKDEHKQMELRMMSEIKLLNGKLTSLEEFRAARDELYNKFAIQEQSMKEQDDNYQRLIYELQKQHLINKNKLRKEMEDKLVKLSTDFQKTTQSRIASTTQNIIRENIAINNELFLLIESWQEIQEENEKLKKKLKDVSLDGTLTKEQLDQTLAKNVLQAQVIERIACEHSRITCFAEEYYQNKKRIRTLEELIKQKEESEKKALHDAQILRQEKQALVVKADELVVNFNKVQCHNSKLERVIHKVTLAVKGAVGIEEDEEELKEADEYGKRQSLINTLLELLCEDFLLISIPEEGDASVPTITSQMWMEYNIGAIGTIRESFSKKQF